MKINSAGSICSGIGAAPLVWNDIDFSWFAEIEEFQSNILKEHYPNVLNLGDMRNISKLLQTKEIEEVDLLCGGTPCQSFSLAGLKEGLKDSRGNLTLEFLKIVDSNDDIRMQKGKKRGFNLWENVEGVLSDKTNAFGILIAGLAGLSDEIPSHEIKKYGVIKGPKRNVAWRVLDAKFFGVPQQRKRVFVLSSDTSYMPENILFEKEELGLNIKENFKKDYKFKKDNNIYEVFREYTDTLYSAYGTKWNGNSAAYNGSLFLAENGKLRRLTPLECERLMGYPDNYTNIKGSSRTKRYQAIGNSWAIPVVKWIKNQLEDYTENEESILNYNLNTSSYPNNIKYGDLKEIVSVCKIENLFLSPVAAAGILRRANERNININDRLEKYLLATSEQMSWEEIEKISKKQKRGEYSKNIENNKSKEQLSFI